MDERLLWQSVNALDPAAGIDVTVVLESVVPALTAAIERWVSTASEENLAAVGLGCTPISRARDLGLENLFKLPIAQADDFLRALALFGSLMKVDGGRISKALTTRALHWLARHGKYATAVAASDALRPVLRSVLGVLIGRAVKYQQACKRPKVKLTEQLFGIIFSCYPGPSDLVPSRDGFLEFVFHERKKIMPLLEKFKSKKAGMPDGSKDFLFDFARFSRSYKGFDVQSSQQNKSLVEVSPDDILVLQVLGFLLTVSHDAGESHDQASARTALRVIQFLTCSKFPLSPEDPQSGEFLGKLREILSKLLSSYGGFGSSSGQNNYVQLLVVSIEFDSTIVLENLKNILVGIHECGPLLTDKITEPSVSSGGVLQAVRNLFDEVGACRKVSDLVEAYCALFKHHRDASLWCEELWLFDDLFYQISKPVALKIFETLAKSAKKSTDAGLLLHRFLMSIKCTRLTVEQTSLIQARAVKVVERTPSTAVKLLLAQVLEFYTNFVQVYTASRLIKSADDEADAAITPEQSKAANGMASSHLKENAGLEDQVVRGVELLLAIRGHGKSGAGAKVYKRLVRQLFDVLVQLDRAALEKEMCAWDFAAVGAAKASDLITCGSIFLDLLLDNVHTLVADSEGVVDDVALLTLADLCVTFRPEDLFQAVRVWEHPGIEFQTAVGLKVFATIAQIINDAAGTGGVLVAPNLATNAREAFVKSSLMEICKKNKRVVLTHSAVATVLDMLVLLGCLPIEAGSKRLHSIFGITTLVCLMTINLATSDPVLLSTVSRYFLASLSLSSRRSTLWDGLSLAPLLPAILARLEAYEGAFTDIAFMGVSRNKEGGGLEEEGGRGSSLIARSSETVPNGGVDVEMAELKEPRGTETMDVDVMGNGAEMSQTSTMVMSPSQASQMIDVSLDLRHCESDKLGKKFLDHGRLDRAVIRKLFQTFAPDINQDIVLVCLGPKLKPKSPAIKYWVLSEYLSVLRTDESTEMNSGITMDFVAPYFSAFFSGKNLDSGTKILKNSNFLELLTKYLDVIPNDVSDDHPVINDYLPGVFLSGIRCVKQLTTLIEDPANRNAEVSKDSQVVENPTIPCSKDVLNLVKFLISAWLKFKKYLQKSDKMKTAGLFKLLHPCVVKFGLLKKNRAAFTDEYVSFIMSAKPKAVLNFLLSQDWDCNSLKETLTANVSVVTCLFQKHLMTLSEEWLELAECLILPAIIHGKSLPVTVCVQFFDVLVVRHRSSINWDILNFIFCYLTSFGGPSSPATQKSCEAWREYLKFLHTLLNSHTHYVADVCPSFFGCIDRSIRALGTPEPLSQLDSQYQESESAAEIARIIVLLGKHWKLFGKFYRYLILQVITAIQRQSGRVQEPTRALLVTALLRLFANCDRQTLAYVKLNVPPECSHFFAQLYDDYVRYYEYKGQI